jgi:hypothetical protein
MKSRFLLDFQRGTGPRSPWAFGDDEMNTSMPLEMLLLPESFPHTLLARQWGVSRRWLASRFRSGELPGKKFGRLWIATKRELLDALSTRATRLRSVGGGA